MKLKEQLVGIYRSNCYAIYFDNHVSNGKLTYSLHTDGAFEL